MGRLLSISLISLPFLAFAGDNATTIETKGSYTTVLVKQIGYSNVATVYCGLSGGTYTTHTCTRAAINISSTGYGNTAKAFSQWSNHSDNVFTVTQNGNNNYGYADLDDDENQGIVIQTGDSNHGEILMAGDNNVYKITQTGDSKYAKSYAFGDNADITVVQLASRMLTSITRVPQIIILLLSPNRGAEIMTPIYFGTVMLTTAQP